MWDTVGSLGIPVGFLRFLTYRKYQFHDTELSSWVDNAFHAVAIDERRNTFRSALWSNEPGDHQWVEQEWFSGVHANVGGGYQEAGLSDVTFLWMMERAEKCGLAMNKAYVKEHIKPNPLGTLYNSRTGWYLFLGTYGRPILRGTVSDTAIERRDAPLEPPYRPRNLEEWLKRR